MIYFPLTHYTTIRTRTTHYVYSCCIMLHVLYLYLVFNTRRRYLSSYDYRLLSTWLKALLMANVKSWRGKALEVRSEYCNFQRNGPRKPEHELHWTVTLYGSKHSLQSNNHYVGLHTIVHQIFQWLPTAWVSVTSSSGSQTGSHQNSVEFDILLKIFWIWLELMEESKDLLV